jgi:TetR/AcrR family transcriptional regulator, transcriptional repressor for nem operon
VRFWEPTGRLNQKAYDVAALADLMGAIGLEKGGIYRHFASIEALVVEAVDGALAETFRARSFFEVNRVGFMKT